jgi:hypothetical protein
MLVSFFRIKVVKYGNTTICKERCLFLVSLIGKADLLSAPPSAAAAQHSSCNVAQIVHVYHDNGYASYGNLGDATV